MKFADIQMLFLVWAVPVCLLVYLYGSKKRERILKAFASPHGLSSIVRNASASRRRRKAGLLLSALALIALALSGPRYGFKWREIEQKGVDLVIALDCSRSMLAADVSPTRLDRAKRKIYDLLTILEGDRAGLVAFAGTAFLQCPLTLDYQAFHIFLNTLTPDYLPVGGTDLGGALQTAMDAFDPEADTEKAVILITDGENTGKEDPLAVAEEARKAGIKLFCIGVGSPTGAPVPEKEGGLKKDAEGKIVVTQMDEKTLEKMAVLTGGAYVRSVAGDMDLDAVYTKEIRGKMDRETLTGGRKQVWEERYQWVLIFAALALAADLFMPPARKPDPRKNAPRKTAAAIIAAIILPALIISAPAAHAKDGGNPMKLGLEAYEKGDYEQALKRFIDAQLNAPDDPKIQYNIGSAYYRLGNFEAAAKSFAEAAKTEDPDLKHKALYNLGNAEFRQQSYDKAIENYEKALEIAPEDNDARQNIAFVKKVQEMQKQQPPQQCDNPKDGEKDPEKDQNKESDREKDPGKEENQEQQQNQQDDAKEKSGDPQDSRQKDQQQQQQAQSQQQPRPKENPEEQQAQAAAAQDKPGEEDPENARQMEMMLNRLKDEPGRALMPHYGNQDVDKDW